MENITKNRVSYHRVFQEITSEMEAGRYLDMPYVGPTSGFWVNPPANHLEIVLPLQGKMVYTVGERPCEVKTGELAIHGVQLGNRRHPDHDEETQSYCVFFELPESPFFSQFENSPPLYRMSITDINQLRLNFENLSHAVLNFGKGSGAYLKEAYSFRASWLKRASLSKKLAFKGAMYSLISNLLTLSERSGHEKGSRELPISVYRGLEYMRSNFKVPELSLLEIARSGGLSINQFGRLFLKFMGQTPMNHLTDLRVQQAIVLLNNTNMRIGEIASAVGYQDPLYFSKVFKSKVGKSPRSYRC